MAAVIITAAAGAASPAQAAELSIETKDGARTAIVMGEGEARRPAALVLHGGIGSAQRMARGSGFAEAAAARGFTAVFPDGIDRQWNDGREGRASSVDDVTFLRRLVGELVARGLPTRHASTWPASPTAA